MKNQPESAGNRFEKVNYYIDPFSKTKLKSLLRKMKMKPAEVMRTLYLVCFTFMQRHHSIIFFDIPLVFLSVRLKVSDNQLPGFQAVP
jgi:hypothetical protein